MIELLNKCECSFNKLEDAIRINVFSMGDMHNLNFILSMYCLDHFINPSYVKDFSAIVQKIERYGRINFTQSYFYFRINVRSPNDPTQMFNSFNLNRGG